MLKASLYIYCSRPACALAIYMIIDRHVDPILRHYDGNWVRENADAVRQCAWSAMLSRLAGMSFSNLMVDRPSPRLCSIVFLYVYAFNQERKKDPYYEDVERPFEGIAAIGRRNVVYPRDPLDTTRLLVKSFSTKEWG